MPRLRADRPRLEQRAVAAARAIADAEPSGDDLLFLHSGLAQLGLPRGPCKARRFERCDGSVSLLVTAGSLWDGDDWVQQPLPNGSKPRLIMLDMGTQVVRSKSNEFFVEGSAKKYLKKRLGLSNTGGRNGPLTAFRRHLGALAACQMQLGFTYRDQALTLNRQLITGFSAWVTADSGRRGLWPGVVGLNADFCDSLRAHAVPLDRRAIRALAGSALALDIYSYLAQRLHRLSKPLDLRWGTLRRQFGQEYKHVRYFRDDFLRQLRAVLAVYPDAKVSPIRGGLRLRPSNPPVPVTRVVVGSADPSRTKAQPKKPAGDGTLSEFGWIVPVFHA